MSVRTKRRCLRGLVKICGEYGVLPNSYIIPKSKIQKLGDEPVSSGGFSDVWPGAYKEDEDKEEKYVAIKVIRYWESEDARRVRKVGYFGLFPSRLSLIVLQSFCQEVITWRRLSHPNVLKLIGVIMDDKEFSMVAPWMDNGNIVDHVREDHQANPIKLARTMFKFIQLFIESGHS